jgi:hypothetical protein
MPAAYLRAKYSGALLSASRRRVLAGIEIREYQCIHVGRDAVE